MTRDFTIGEAVERYLKERKADISDSTLYNHRSALQQFIAFCEQEGITVANNIDAFLISDFRLHRQEQVSDTTVYNNLSSLRSFIYWCEGRGLVDEAIADNMILPDLEGESRETMIEMDTDRKSVV